MTQLPPHNTNGHNLARDGAHVFPRANFQEAVFNALMRTHDSTSGWLLPPWGRLGRPNDNRLRIDFDAECGYPLDEELDIEWFKSAYARWGVAARFVDIWADECWVVYPTITDSADPGESDFEKAIGEVSTRTLLPHYMHRIDRLSGIGQYGILFLGFDDGGRLDRPPPGIDGSTGKPLKDKKVKYNLNYVRAFDQTVVRVDQRESNFRSPRNGQPTYYSIRFNADVGLGLSGATGREPVVDSGTLQRIHWTRVIHVADNRWNSEIFGTPRLLQIANNLIDLRKVVGGSAQMFWQGGFPGYAFETYPDLMGDTTVNPDELREQIDGYSRGLQRFLATVGGKWTSLQPQVADPANHLQWYVKLMCATVGVPYRIFLGSEEGQLAGQQDDEAWRNRCNGRQVRYLEPFLLRPVVDRLIDFGVFPKPIDGRYSVKWRDLQVLSDKDRADVALKKVQALQTFYSAFVDQKFPDKLMHTLIMGFTEEQSQAITDELKRHPPKKPDPALLPAAKPNPGGLRSGAAPAAPAGRPRGRVEGKPKAAAAKPGAAARKAKDAKR